MKTPMDYILIIPFPEYFEQTAHEIEEHLKINLKYSNPPILIRVFLVKPIDLPKIISLLGNKIDKHNQTKPIFTLKFESGNTSYSLCGNILKIFINCNIHPLSEKILFFGKT